MTGRRWKKQRLRDFEMRAAGEPDGVRKLIAGGDIVTIHPLADERELLLRLGMRDADCVSVDGYWSVGGDIVFLQLRTTTADVVRSVGLYGRIGTYPPHYVTLLGVVDDPFISSEVLEGVVRRLLEISWTRERLDEGFKTLKSGK